MVNRTTFTDIDVIRCLINNFIFYDDFIESAYHYDSPFSIGGSLATEELLASGHGRVFSSIMQLMFPLKEHYYLFSRENMYRNNPDLWQNVMIFNSLRRLDREYGLNIKDLNEIQQKHEPGVTHTAFVIERLRRRLIRQAQETQTSSTSLFNLFSIFYSTPDSQTNSAKARPSSP